MYHNEVAKITQMVKRMRSNILTMAFKVGNKGAHVGPALSMVEIMAVLYGHVMKFRVPDPEWAARDRFYLSKGHGALAYYAALYEVGYLTEDDLGAYGDNGGPFPAQPTMNLSKGIEFSSGSLGLGLSPAIGSALASRSLDAPFKVYALLGNGECNEGTVWEAAMSAAAFNLDNLVAIIDNNGIQSDGFSKDVLDMGNITSKWESFGWMVRSVDGHDIEALLHALTKPWEAKPLLILANTVKGKGVSFMENNKDWHHNVLTDDLYEIAMKEQRDADANR